MSTRPLAGRPLAARQIKIGGLYRTTVESGEMKRAEDLSL